MRWDQLEEGDVFTRKGTTLPRLALRVRPGEGGCLLAWLDLATGARHEAWLSDRDMGAWDVLRRGA